MNCIKYPARKTHARSTLHKHLNENVCDFTLSFKSADWGVKVHPALTRDHSVQYASESIEYPLYIHKRLIGSLFVFNTYL